MQIGCLHSILTTLTVVAQTGHSNCPTSISTGTIPSATRRGGRFDGGRESLGASTEATTVAGGIPSASTGDEGKEYDDEDDEVVLVFSFAKILSIRPDIRAGRWLLTKSSS